MMIILFLKAAERSPSAAQRGHQTAVCRKSLHSCPEYNTATIKPLTVCRSQNPSVGFMRLQNSWTQKIGTRFSASADFVTLWCALSFGRKWRKFGVNPFSHAPRIKDSCGFLAVISTCRPCRPCHHRLREQRGVRAGQRPGSRWSAPSQRRMLRSPERNG